MQPVLFSKTSQHFPLSVCLFPALSFFASQCATHKEYPDTCETLCIFTIRPLQRPLFFRNVLSIPSTHTFSCSFFSLHFIHLKHALLQKSSWEFLMTLRTSPECPSSFLSLSILRHFSCWDCLLSVGLSSEAWACLYRTLFFQLNFLQFLTHFQNARWEINTDLLDE